MELLQLSSWPWLYLVVGFQTVVYLFETYLDLRQLQALKRPSLPPQLKGIVSEEKFEKSKAYQLDKSYFGLLHSVVGQIEQAAILLFGVLPWLWLRSGDILREYGYKPEDHEILQSLLFLAIQFVWSQVTDLPWSIYSTFVIEQVHGFNKQTPALFVKDLVKGYALTAIIAPPIIAGVITIVKVGGPYLAVYLWAFLLVLSLVMMVLYPLVIAPLFNTYTALPEGTLRTEIEKLAASLSYPLKKLFVVNGSIRSGHSNAYLYGFFKNKRIVLYDTLLEQCKKDDEVVAVIGHELGHWKLNHTVYTFLAQQVIWLVYMGGFQAIKGSKVLYQSFGFDSEAVLIGLLLFGFVIGPVSHTLSFVFNIVSRTFEYQADAFAVHLGYAEPLKVGLIRLQEENLSAMNLDPWYSTYHFSHPPLIDRLGAINSQSKKRL
eukprot:TRINITY_DN17285_c0_g1_i1.p1 TRINITY_DN17285_c0_g1~~TRINITY_DN17285_c0_g1_i1.p1  ORF type:complete len:432 (-),score=113.02 TRINITY_DN17285_c0_g1_i1:190-1485(-)